MESLLLWYKKINRLPTLLLRVSHDWGLRVQGPWEHFLQKIKIFSCHFKTLYNLGHTIIFVITSYFHLLFTSSITDILISKMSFVHVMGFIWSVFPCFEGSSFLFSSLYTYSFYQSPVQYKCALPRLCWQFLCRVNSYFSEILPSWLSEPFIWYLSSTSWHFSFCGLHSYLIFCVWISFHLC